MTPQDIITSARYILNDTDSVLPRQSSTELLGYVNAGLLEIALLRPELFQKVGDYTCIPSQSEQSITFSDALSLIKVLSIHGGAALTQFDIGQMDAFLPGWRASTVASASQWGAYPGDELRFFVYPPAPATTQVLDVLYVKIPSVLAIGDSITEIPASLSSALVDFVVARASQKDDEHSDSGRAVASYNAFVSKVKGGTQ